MKKEQNKKVMACLYIIIGLLLINTICHFIVLSKVGEPKTTSKTETTETTNTYDVSMFTTLKSSEVTKKIKNGDQFVLFIGQQNCTFCQKMLSTLQKAQSEYKYTTVYLNIANEDISSNDYKEMASLLDIKKTVNGETKEFGEFQLTPMLAVISKGKMIDGMIGYNTYENFAKFLENAGIIK